MNGYVGLGSDLGDRRAALREALRRMAAGGMRPEALSSVWETEPVDVEGSEGFLNMVVAIRVPSGTDPESVLNGLLAIETAMGRTRGDVPRSRVVDLDLLVLGEEMVRTKRLTLPHPRMWERRFVLAPLEEIAPDLRDPESGLTVRDILRRLPERPWARRVGTLDPPEPAPVYSRRS